MISTINQDVNVTASGSGEATLTMVSLYYAQPKEKESDCQRFNLSVQLLPAEKLDDEEDKEIYKLKIEVLFKDEERDATMSILDIGLLTGFTVNINDLNLQSRGSARTIAKYDMDTVLSERSSLIIYMDKVSHTQPEEITFRIHQQLKVGALKPAAVSVYEYYDPTQCVRFYVPEQRRELWTCVKDTCTMQRKGNISNDERTAKSCETTPHSRMDFVYKVKVEEFTGGLSSDIYTARIVEAIKEGSYDVGVQGTLRTFLNYAHCKTALDLRAGKSYLIMGSSKEILKDEQNKLYQYVLGESTWIEYWPTEDECQAEEHRRTCSGMEELVAQHTLFGCWV